MAHGWNTFRQFRLRLLHWFWFLAEAKQLLAVKVAMSSTIGPEIFTSYNETNPTWLYLDPHLKIFKDPFPGTVSPARLPQVPCLQPDEHWWQAQAGCESFSDEMGALPIGSSDQWISIAATIALLLNLSALPFFLNFSISSGSLMGASVSTYPCFSCFGQWILVRFCPVRWVEPAEGEFHPQRGRSFGWIECYLVELSLCHALFVWLRASKAWCFWRKS